MINCLDPVFLGLTVFDKSSAGGTRTVKLGNWKLRLSSLAFVEALLPEIGGQPGQSAQMCNENERCIPVQEEIKLQIDMPSHIQSIDDPAHPVVCLDLLSYLFISLL